MPLYFNADNSIADFNAAQIAAMNIQTYKIENGEHPTHRREFNSSTIGASYMIAYAQYENFCAYMMGGSALYMDSGGVLRLSRLMPQTWPGKPTFACTRIDSTEGHQFDGDDNAGPWPVPTYTSMKVDLTFQDCPFALTPDLFPIESPYDETRRYLQVLPSESSAEYISLPGGIMRLVTTAGVAPPGAGAPPQVNHNVGIPIPSQIIKRKWLRLPYDAWGVGSILYSRIFGNPETNPTTQSFIGTVNQVGMLGYLPGQLLMLAPEEEIQLDPIGGQVWNVTYKWLVKPQGHNFFYWYPAAGGGAIVGTWCFATADGSYYPTATLPDGKSVFNARDHRLAFAVGASL